MIDEKSKLKEIEAACLVRRAEYLDSKKHKDEMQRVRKYRAEKEKEKEEKRIEDAKVEYERKYGRKYSPSNSYFDLDL